MPAGAHGHRLEGRAPPGDRDRGAVELRGPPRMKILPPYKKAAPREDCLDADPTGIARVDNGSRERDHAVRVDIREDLDLDAADVGRGLMLSPNCDPEVRGGQVGADLEVRAEAF